MKDFREDLQRLEQRLKRHEPLAFTRFADGELKILLGESIDVLQKENGEFCYSPADREDQFFRERLCDAFQFNSPDYWVGIACPCCVGEEHSRFMRRLCGLPDEQCTWANLFVNANYGYYKEHVVPLFRDYQVYAVANRSAEIGRLPFPVYADWRVGTNAWRSDYALIERIQNATAQVTGALFLFSAGPMSNFLVHQLFRSNPNNTYLNVGSTLDPWLFGDRGKTRIYLRGGPTLYKYCQWISDDSSAAEIGPARTSMPLQLVPSSPLSENISGRAAEPRVVPVRDRVQPDIAVVLGVYRRPHLLKRQIAAIRAQSILAKSIWIWANEPDQAMEDALQQVPVERIVRSSTNGYFHDRFALALTARTEYVAVFDDDTIPGSRWLENCLHTMNISPGILGAAGVRITDAGYEGRTLHGWHAPSNTLTEVDLVGHAWFLRTEWLKYLFAEPAVTGNNGEDIELSARAWRLGKVPSYCPPHPSDSTELWGSLLGSQCGDDQVAASRRPAHLLDRNRIVQAELQAGWKPLLLRSQSNGHNGDGLKPVRPPELTDSIQNGSFEARALANAAVEVPVGLGDPEKLFVSELADHILCFEDQRRPTAASIRHSGHAKVTSVSISDETDWDDLECLLGTVANQQFDCIVLGGALEHVKRPDVFLEKCLHFLSPGGEMFATVANLRHHGTVASLFHGRFPGWRHGRTGSDPIRFFTRRELEKVFFRAGMETIQLRLVPGAGWQAWHENGRPSNFAAAGIEITGRNSQEAEEFYAAQLQIRVRRAPRSSPGLTSIVLVTFNQLAFTHQCLESIRFRTDEPYEIIIVDNGSTDGTVGYLQSQSDVRLIINPDNRGFPAAANQGILAARGSQVLLLNNDTLATTGWLSALLNAFAADPMVGLAGPCSNEVSGEQRVPAGYSDLASLDGFAWDWCRANRGQPVLTDRLVGFCLLIRREVIDKIGLLDERFGIGNFEDDDYCVRAAKAGFRLVIVRDSFLHHFGHRSFLAAGVDLNGLLDKNKQLFRDKWAGGEELPVRNYLSEVQASNALPGRLSARVGESGGLLLVRERVRLSACLIVRDNESIIRPCLESIRPWVDELIVVDTGSQDSTPAIAKELGAQLFHFPWCDDFAAARNESLRHARGEWLFWMDSDDTIDALNGQKLRELANAEAPTDVLGYVMQVHCPGSGRDRDFDVTVVDHIKMFRSHPELRFEGRIHEQVLPAIRRLHGRTSWTDIFVVHSGAVQTPEGHRRKQQRDLRILKLDLADRPDHPFVLFNLGMTYADMADHATAIAYLERCLAMSDLQESHVRKAHALLVASHVQLGDYDKASKQCVLARRLFPADPELLFREGILAHHAGRLQAAVDAYVAVLAGSGERHFSSIDRGIVGFKARHNLALVYEDLGDEQKAIQQWELIINEVPEYPNGWRGLIDNYLRTGKYGPAEAVIERMMQIKRLHGEAFRALAQVAIAHGDLVRAKRNLLEGDQACAGQEEPLRSLCHFLFEHGEPTETVSALVRLSALVPEDASVQHNLATAYLRIGDASLALRSFDEALRLRPADVTSHLYRGYALEQLNRDLEAMSAYREAERLSPGNRTAADAHARLQALRRKIEPARLALQG
jgi:GT2 family glycosyltransferase/tetratricopeptide (TPR) repeat protein